MAEGDLHFKAYIDTDTTSFQRNIKQAQNSVNSLSSTFGGLSKVITKALSFVGITASVGAIVKFGKESVKAAENANKSFNVLNNTIKATGATAWTTTEDMVQMSKELADSSNYAVSEIQDMQSVLLGFRNITGDTFEEASEAIMDMATVMGMDLKSATQTVGKALDDPIKGLDSLRRQGFQFTDEQKAQLEQLVKNGNQLEAQKIILEELSTTYGGAAKAAQSSFARMRNATTELKETLGNQLMPVINEVLSNSTNTIKQLTVEIQKIDFGYIFAIIKNIANMIKPVFEEIINYFKSFGGEIKGFFNSDTMKPFVSILDTLLGVLKSIFGEIKSNFDKVKEMFTNIKEGLGGLGNSGALQNITNVINKIIDVIWFLREQINVVAEDARTLIFDKIKAIWNFFKQLFENSQTALEESEKGFASWAEYLYSKFDQIFRIAQDFINGISAILHGNWAVAWEYAKLATMRACKIVLDSISQIANAFPSLINKMLTGVNWLIEQINKFREWIGQEPIDLLGAFESVDLTESSGLGKAITDAENKIQELTGKAADVGIESLKGISKASQGMAKQMIGDITNVTDSYVQNGEKQKAVFNDVANTAESSYEAYSEWDSKLLQQRQANLKEWQKEYHEINLKLIEEERKKALEEDKTGKESVKINKYYDNMILQEKKRYFGQMASIAKNTVSKIAEFFKSLAGSIGGAIKTAVSIFKKLFQFNTDDALDNLLAFEDSVLTFFVETLPKLPAFVASALQSISVLLKNVLNSDTFNAISDILFTIIDNVTNVLPDIIAMLFPIVEKLIDSILSLFGDTDFVDRLLDLIEQATVWIANLLETKLPIILEVLIKIVKKITEKTPELLKILIPALANAIKMILEALPEIIDVALDSLPTIFKEILPMLIKEINTLIPVIIQVILLIVVEIIKHLPEIVWAIIQGLVKCFTETNWWQVIKECFMGFINAFKKLFGIHSPSTVFADFGKDMIKGLWNGIKSMGEWLNKNVGGFFKKVVNAIVSIFSEIGDWIYGVFADVFSGVGDWFYNIFLGAANGVKRAFQGIGDWFEKIFDGIVNVLKAPINVLIKGINYIIDGLNKISIKIPSWVPGIGGKEFGVNISNIDYLANGTQNATRGLAIVGEAGPELVKFNGGEQVLNNRNTNKALANMGKGGNVFNVTFENTVDTTAFAMMKQLRNYQRNLAFNGVL